MDNIVPDSCMQFIMFMATLPDVHLLIRSTMFVVPVMQDFSTAGSGKCVQ